MSDIFQKKKPFSFSDTVVILSILAMVAKAAGFAEKMVIAHYFGTDASADIYFAATGIVLSIVFLVKELVHPTLLPVLAKALKESPAVSTTLVRRFLLLSGAALVVFGIVVALFSSQLTTIFVPGFSPEKKTQMSVVLRYLSPACIFMSLSMVTYTILNAYKKFSRAAISETVYKFLVLIGLFVLIPLLGLKAVPVVLSFAAIVLFITMLTGIPEKRGWLVEGRADSDDLSKVFKLMGPIAIGVVFSHISGLVDNILASTLPTGHLSYLGYSKKLIDAILLIGPVALVTVSYPHLAGLFHGSKADYISLFVKVLRALIYMGIPGSILIVALREPIIRLLFEGGRFDLDSTVGTSRGLLIYGFGFLAFAIESHLVYTFYAISDTKTPVSVGIGCVILDVIVAVSLIRVMGYLGIALALVISKSAKVLILGFLLERRLNFIENSKLFPYLSKTVLAAVPSALFLLYLSHFTAGKSLIIRGLVEVLLPAAGFFVAYAGFSVLFGIEEIRQLQELFYRLLRIRKRAEP